MTTSRKKELLTPRQFLKLIKNNKSKIVKTKIVPPKLGENGFGKIMVVHRKPSYTRAAS